MLSARLDKECGALYVCFQPEREGERGVVRKTFTVEVQVDFDADGNLYGMEILDPEAACDIHGAVSDLLNK